MWIHTCLYISVHIRTRFYSSLLFRGWSRANFRESNELFSFTSVSQRIYARFHFFCCGYIIVMWIYYRDSGKFD